MRTRNHAALPQTSIAFVVFFLLSYSLASAEPTNTASSQTNQTPLNQTQTTTTSVTQTQQTTTTSIPVHEQTAITATNTKQTNTSAALTQPINATLAQPSQINTTAATQAPQAIETSPQNDKTAEKYSPAKSGNSSGPITVNGDTVEYSSDSKNVTATGNVVVEYKGAKLTCEKLTVNMQTKDGIAEGNVRLDDKAGVITAEKLYYNFENKSGNLIGTGFRANPYFGKARTINKNSDNQFVAIDGYATTCSFDHPHYRLASKKIIVVPNDKIQLKGSTVYLGSVPAAYLPQYNHSLEDHFMHLQILPGTKKDWGPFLLTGWRYNLSEDVSGKITRTIEVSSGQLQVLV